MFKQVGRVVLILGLMALTAVGVWLIAPWAPKQALSQQGSASANAKPPEAMPVEGLKLVPKPMEATVHAVGALVPNEAVDVSSEVARRVTKILFEDGAKVKKDDVLFELDATDLAAQSNEIAVRRKLLVDNEARQKRLLGGGVGNQADYERARSELELLDAQWSSLSVALTRTKIRAPFDGQLGLRNISVGAMLTPGRALVTLQDTSRFKLDFSVPERYAPIVSAGGRFTFRVENDATEYEGKVVATEPRIDDGTRSLRVRGLVKPPEASSKLVAGAFVHVVLAVGGAADSIFVPNEIVIPSLGGHALYKHEDGTAKLVDVKVGLRTDTEVQITKGLVAGDVVITSNILRLRPGAKVKLTEPAADAP